ncbi:hypothetical protein [Magnetovibrio blakemorei]|uniref:VWFA domain-containing protein n=1 Tax=Magnetovibrio blakemorei TaxID=28181 RepID=C4RAD4_9PROT|nr:hypothetical protein [Magnetovibrio blakemorei]OEJ64949.1 hypothetical protein BEN30_00375 [Magnetovibrio blakemorei]CAV30779.1 conserved hypothetical protein [Magnetovibrio blakemorei]
MAYSQEICRDYPGAFLFLVDQSRSMHKPFGVDGAGKPVERATVVAEALNSTLEEIVNRCMRDEGVSDYFDVGIIGYGKTSRPAFCWQGSLAGRGMVPISEVADNAIVETKEIETLVRDQIVKETVTVSRWVEPVAAESTPMNGALQLARAAIQDWIFRHPKSFPPIVINITDGMANDVSSEEELLNSARRLTSLKTTDGNVLMVNCHISDNTARPVVFPWNALELPDDTYAKLLFEMSSEMPDRYRSVICEIFDRDLSSTPAIRGMAFNADAMALVKLLDIGTRQAFVFSEQPPASAHLHSLQAV